MCGCGAPKSKTRGAPVTDDLTPDDILAIEAKADTTPAEVDPTAADLPDDVEDHEIVDTRTPEDI